MKILHTADWHLGKRLDNFPRHEEQVAVLEEIIQIADTHNVDIVIIAGDLYDSVNPPLESQSLFYTTLKRLAKDGARPVIAIAGNHDSPDRIDSPDPLARACGIIFIGKPKAIIPQQQLNDKFIISKTDEGFIEIIKDNHPPLRIIHTAYANEQRLKTYLGEDKSKGLNDVLSQHWMDLANKYCDTNGINILTTHLYIQHGNEALEEPEGEKPLKIGNADIVYTAAIPSQIQYTALGHLHQYHNIGTETKPIVYSSSPLAYSFSEALQSKYVVIIDALPNEAIQMEKITLQQGRKLYKKSFIRIEDAIIWLEENPNTLVELTIYTDTFLTPAETKQLYYTHDGIIYIIPKVNNKSDNENRVSRIEIDLTQDVTTLFKEYYQHKHDGVAPNQELLDIFQEIIAE
jgi:exonuclease SbcD